MDSSRLGGLEKETTQAQNPHVRNCWVLGIERLIVDHHGGVDDFFEIRAEWADSTVLVLRRSWFDLTRILKKLRDSFPEEIEASAESLLIEGLYGIKEAEDNEAKFERVEEFLRTVITMPSKYSQSEAVLSFFEASHLDLMIGNNLDPTQLLLYSPITISEIRRSNGFCLANTETIICDTCPPPEISLPIGSMGHVYEKTSEAEGKRVLHTFSGDHDKGPNPDSEVIHIMKTEANPIMKPPRQGIASEVYMSKMTYLHMEAHETDILE